MRENISLDDFVNEKLLKGYFNRLYKICRSILGKGFRESLDIIGEIVELNKKKVSSGTKVLDWTVPDEWNIRDAYIITPSGKKIANFKLIHRIWGIFVTIGSKFAVAIAKKI